MAELTISVIISHYQQNQLLGQCLRSLACQLRTADEVIVLDDGSRNPPTIDELRQHLPLKALRLIVNKTNSGGPAIPRNQGVQICTSSHAVFVDADDILLPHALLALSAIWVTKPMTIAYGDQICWGPKHRRPFLQLAMQTPAIDKACQSALYEQLLMRGNGLFLSGTGGATTHFKQHPFDPEQHWEDYDLWLRLAEAGLEFQHTGHIHTLYRLNAGSRSGSRAARHRGCQGIQSQHFKHRPCWRWPLWFWKQRYL